MPGLALLSLMRKARDEVIYGCAKIGLSMDGCTMDGVYMDEL